MQTDAWMGKVLLLLPMLAACGSSQHTDAQVTVGFAYAYSDPAGAPALLENGIRVAQSLVNSAAGYSKRVAVKTYDTGTDGNSFFTAINEAILTDKVTFLVLSTGYLTDPNDIARLATLTHEHQVVSVDIGGLYQPTNAVPDRDYLF